MTTLEDHVNEFDISVPYKHAKKAFVEAWELCYLRRLMKVSEGNISKAARIAKKDRRDMVRLVRKYGLKASAVPPTSEEFQSTD